MKIKTLLISLGVGALVAGGGVLAARQAAIRSRKSVEVMPVVNADLTLQYASWGFDSEDSMYGTIVSKDTQTVNLSIGNGQTLKSVNVSEGDEVKTGDVLMEYDVRKKLLEREAHDLSLQLSRIGLQRLENELEEIRRKNPGLFVDIEQAQMTSSADVLSVEDAVEELETETEEESETGLSLLLDDWLVEPAGLDLYEQLLQDATGNILQTQDLPDGISGITGGGDAVSDATDDLTGDLPDGILGEGSGTGGTSLFDAVENSSDPAAARGEANTSGDTTGETTVSEDISGVPEGEDGSAGSQDTDVLDGSDAADLLDGSDAVDVIGGQDDQALPAEDVLPDEEVEDGFIVPEDGDLPEGEDAFIDGEVLPDVEDGFADESVLDVEDETGFPEDTIEDGETEEEDDLSELDQKIHEATDFSVTPSDTDVIGTDEDALDGESTTDLSEESGIIQDNLRIFLRVVNLLTRQYTENPATLKSDDLEQARLLYQSALAREEMIRPFLDAFGESRSVPLYVPGTDTLRALKEMEDKYSDFDASDTLKALHQAYANYLFYRLWYQMNLLENAMNKDLAKVTTEEAVQFQDMIREVTDSYYELYFFWRYLKQSVPKLAESSKLYEPLPEVYLDELKASLISFVSNGKDKIDEDLFETYPILGRGYKGKLSILVDRLFDNSLLELDEYEEETEDFTEDFDDFGDDGGDDAETAQELRDMFFDKLMAIRSQRLSIRQGELDLKKDDEAIEKATVRASLDGVVRSAGTMEEGTSSTEAFIVVAGEMGMYAVGSVSEMDRDTIAIGDVVTGTCEDTGQEFTATVTEVLDYPTTGDDDFYFYSSSTELTNSNASQYQFYAYIEDTTGVEEGYATLSLQKEQEAQTGIMLEDYFVREEDFGNYYVYIRGEDGRIKKQYVKVGKGSMFGSGKNIIEGLDYEDLIAFPADNIREGDPTTEVDFLEDIYY